jgi:dodecin
MAVIKIIELMGISKNSWEDAANEAVKEAAKTLRGIRGVDVKSQTAKVADGKIVEYHTTVNVAFPVEN